LENRNVLGTEEDVGITIGLDIQWLGGRKETWNTGICNVVWLLYEIQQNKSKKRYEDDGIIEICCKESEVFK